MVPSSLLMAGIKGEDFLSGEMVEPVNILTADCATVHKKAMYPLIGHIAHNITIITIALFFPK